jgi:hypothetical protein
MHEFLFLIVVKLIVWVDATSDTTCNLYDFFLFQIAVKLIVGGLLILHLACHVRYCTQQ